MVLQAGGNLLRSVRKSLSAVMPGFLVSVVLVWLLSPGVLLNLPPMDGQNAAPVGLANAQLDLRQVPLESNLGSALVHAVVMVLVLRVSGGLVVSRNA